MAAEIVAEDTVVVVVVVVKVLEVVVGVAAVVEALSFLPSTGTDHHPWHHPPPKVCRLSFIALKA